MQALGVQYDLEGIWDGQLVVQNKPGRLERILQLTKEFNDNKKGEGQIAATIGGLLNFSGGFVLGHSLKPATQLLYRWMSPSRPSDSLKAELCDLIRVLIHDVKPKKVTVNHIETTVLIYTDGAFENEVETWGALVIDPTPRRATFLRVQFQVTGHDFGLRMLDNRLFVKWKCMLIFV